MKSAEAHDLRGRRLLADLLAQERQAHVALFLGEVEHDIIFLACAGPEADHTACGEPLSRR